MYHQLQKFWREHWITHPVLHRVQYIVIVLQWLQATLLDSLSTLGAWLLLVSCCLVCRLATCTCSGNKLQLVQDYWVRPAGSCCLHLLPQLTRIWGAVYSHYMYVPWKLKKNSLLITIRKVHSGSKVACRHWSTMTNVFCEEGWIFAMRLCIKSNELKVY